tara:strand:- start:108 stop:1850 length:1743 start_codon:yes stop_codon:yes gene_type:complete
MALTSNQEIKVVRVIPDIDAISGEYDYAIPEEWHGTNKIEEVSIGAIVRFRFRNRLIRGWVSQINPKDVTEKTLLPLKQVSGIGPSEEVISLARWSANYWQGPVARFLRIASPKVMLKARLSEDRQIGGDSAKEHAIFSSTVKRLPPTGDRWPIILETISKGNALILVPSVYQARLLVGRLRAVGLSAGLYGKEWMLGVRGATIVGTRSAAFASIKNLSAILMLDEHDGVYQNEAAPTWHAREVVLERAKRLNIPVIFTSPIPTPEVRDKSVIATIPSFEEKSGWGDIKIVDPREDGTSRGGLWPRVTLDALKSAQRAVVVLNRKGRSKLLACSACNELVVCAECGSGMYQPDDNQLMCQKNNHSRPVSCSFCLSTRLKNLRVGISRAVEELELLLQEKVLEVQADTKDIDLASNRFFLGTNAVLHRVDWADLVVFADFDQDLFAKGYRSEEIALTSIIRAARITNAVGKDTGTVHIQTRSSGNHLVEVLRKKTISEWGSLETDRRSLLSLPPFGSYASISGPGAEEFLEKLLISENLEVLGPSEGSWIIKSVKHEDLLLALSSAPRPLKRLRVAINPMS